MTDFSKAIEERIAGFDTITRDLLKTANERDDEQVKGIVLRAISAHDQFVSALQNKDIKTADEARKRMVACLAEMAQAVDEKDML